MVISEGKLNHLSNHLNDFFVNGKVMPLESIAVYEGFGKPIRIVDKEHPEKLPQIVDNDHILEIIRITEGDEFLLKVINALVRNYAAEKQEEVNALATELDPPQDWKHIWDGAVDWQSRHDCLSFDVDTELRGASTPRELIFASDRRSLILHGTTFKVTRKQYTVLEYLNAKKAHDASVGIRTRDIRLQFGWKPSFKVPNLMKTSKGDGQSLFGKLLKWRPGHYRYYYLDLDYRPDSTN